VSRISSVTSRANLLSGIFTLDFPFVCIALLHSSGPAFTGTWQRLLPVAGSRTDCVLQ
jgi:hypothetical protein